MGRVILGTKGFEYTLRGTVPPEIENDPAAVTMWVAGNTSFSTVLAGFVKESRIIMVDLSTPAQPGLKLQ